MRQPATSTLTEVMGIIRTASLCKVVYALNSARQGGKTGFPKGLDGIAYNVVRENIGPQRLPSLIWKFRVVA
jgi:hypothetical protein